jgi:hypothetical protein
MDLHRIAVKFFLAEPAGAQLREIVPVFHRWIQTSAIRGTLIDVADYAHLPQSPGVVLVAHEATLMLDETEGPRGLLYVRKTPLPGSLAERFKTLFRDALQACDALEQEGLRFRTDEAWVLSNDRLAAPNDDATFAALKPALAEAAKAAWGKDLELLRDVRDPRTRLTVRLKAPGGEGVAALAARLGPG